MALETATYIDDLVPANPSGTDRLQFGDDHIRMIKQVLKNTFPNITGPVTKTQDDLNATAFTFPIGIISIWYGASIDVPNGWAVCNGQTVARSDGLGDITTPDLRDRVVIGAGTLAAQGIQIGATTASGTTTAAGAHTHTISGGEHTHTIQVQSATTNATLSVTTDPIDGSGGQSMVQSVSITNPPAHTHVATAESAPHSHTMDTAAAHQHTVQVSTMQPATGLHYIMKV